MRVCLCYHDLNSRTKLLKIHDVLISNGIRSTLLPQHKIKYLENYTHFIYCNNDSDIWKIIPKEITSICFPSNPFLPLELHEYNAKVYLVPYDDYKFELFTYNVGYDIEDIDYPIADRKDINYLVILNNYYQFSEYPIGDFIHFLKKYHNKGIFVMHDGGPDLTKVLNRAKLPNIGLIDWGYCGRTKLILTLPSCEVLQIGQSIPIGLLHIPLNNVPNTIENHKFLKENFGQMFNIFNSFTEISAWMLKPVLKKYDIKRINYNDLCRYIINIK